MLILTQFVIFKEVGADDPVAIASDFYDYIKNIPDGSAILLPIWYEQSNMNELFPMTLAVMHQLFQKDVKVILVTFQSEGTEIINQALELINPQSYNKTYGVNWINLGYVVGNEAAVAALAFNLNSTSIDYQGTPLEQFPIMQNVNSSDINLVLLISDNNLGIFSFLRQWSNTPIVFGCTSKLYPSIIPFQMSGQIPAILYGFSSVAEYEKLISMPNYFKITSPNGGENWLTGSNHNIMWAYSGVSSGFVKIELLKNNIVNLVISSSTENDGAYNWMIPPNQIIGSDYTIKITSTTNTTITDTSNNKFIINKPQVASGDWVKYAIYTTWYSNNQSATEPNQIKEQKELKWIKIEIKNFSEIILMSQTNFYQNGTEKTLAPISGNFNKQFLTYIIPNNLQKGDKIPGENSPFNLIDESQGFYAGMKRNLTYTNFNISLFGMNMTIKMYWDRFTGILCEMNTTVSMQVESYIVTSLVSTKMIETNLWKMETQLSCSILLDTIKEGNSVSVSGLIDAGLPDKSVIITYRKPDGSLLNRTVTTGVNGYYNDSFTPEASGLWSLTASWNGDLNYAGATSLQKTFTVTPKQFFETSLGMASIVIAIIAITLIVLLLVKKRKS